MKIVTKILIVILIVLMFIMPIVNAKTYNITNPNMAINIDDSYIDIFTEYDENKEKLSNIVSEENYNQYVQAGKKQGICVDLVKLNSENKSTIEIIVDTSSLSKDFLTRDLKDLNDEELKNYKERFIGNLKEGLGESEFEIIDNEIYIADDGDKYIFLSTNTSKQEADSFYTVKNYKLIGINVTCAEGTDIDEKELKEIVNNIHIEDTTYNDSFYDFVEILAFGLLCITIIVVSIIKKIKYKNGVDITNQQKEKYSKFGGFLKLLLVLLTLDCIFIVITGFIYILNSTIVAYAMEAVRCVIMLILAILTLKNIRIRSIDSAKKIKAYMYIMLAINIVVAISGILYSILDTENVYMNQFYVTHIINIVTSISRTVVFTTYFTVSKRAKVYYGLYNK